VTVRGEIAVALGLLLHEMATNAVKYGALSNAQGRVKLRRKTTPAGHAAFEWREADGPPVRPSNRQGFGTRLLQQVLRGQGGMVTFDFEPQGFRARVDCPTGG
jgi:two-component sensor histidine kinase